MKQSSSGVDLNYTGISRRKRNEDPDILNASRSPLLALASGELLLGDRVEKRAARTLPLPLQVYIKYEDLADSGPGQPPVPAAIASPVSDSAMSQPPQPGPAGASSDSTRSQV